jgi:serine/threonine protein kinase
VHRDIKPENFLLGAPTLLSAPAGTAAQVLKISDFGVSAFHQPGEVRPRICCHACCCLQSKVPVPPCRCWLRIMPNALCRQNVLGVACSVGCRGYRGGWHNTTDRTCISSNTYVLTEDVHVLSCLFLRCAEVL